MRLFYLLMILALLPVQLLADTTRVWDNQPITLTLPVDAEIRVIFPVPVQIQVPESLTEKLISTAPNQQIVYWKATQKFDRARVIATAVDHSVVYLLDIQASTDGTKESIVIEDANKVISQKQEEAKEQDNEQPELQDPAELVLTRFAAQTLYAPTRLVPNNKSINKVDGARIAADFPLLESQAGEHYTFQVVGAWAGFGHYITAVLVVNQSLVALPVNPGLVHGNFTNITSQHLQLGPKGSLEDRTTLYLISDKPFVDALAEDGYGY